MNIYNIQRKVYYCCFCLRGWIGNIRKLKGETPSICPRCKHRFTESYKPVVIGELSFGLSHSEKVEAVNKLIEKYVEKEVNYNG